jgi:alpha-N-arabinofuranosidase
MGRLRAENGHPTPYDVRYWEIGNELYGSWQIGHTDAAGYAERYDQFVRAVNSADPNILIIANGRDAEWNRVLVKRAETPVRSISVHTLPGGGIPPEADPRTVFREFMAHANAYQGYLARVASPMSQVGMEAKLAVTELQVFTNKPSLPNNATLTEALWTAGIINSCIRSGIVELLTHSAMLNHGGGLRKVRGIVYPNPVWWTTHLYGASDGQIPTGVEVICPTFSTAGRWLTKHDAVPYLDAMGLLSPDSANLTLFVVNRHDEEPIQTEISLKGFFSVSEADVQLLAGSSFMERNEWNRTAVDLVGDKVPVRNGTVDFLLPPLSLSRFTFESRLATQ